MHIICLDTEATGTPFRNEILELSVYNGVGKEIFSKLFKPKRCKSWPRTMDIHGITPIMVRDKKSFQSCLREIQPIFDHSDLIVGFALSNDISLLRQSGILRITNDKCFDVRELFWAVYGEELGLDLFHIPNLIKCAEYCGFSWENDLAHSASADTKATLYCFDHLLEKYARRYEIGKPEQGISLEAQIAAAKRTGNGTYTGRQIKEILTHLQHLVEADACKRAREKARGYVFLCKSKSGYYIVPKRKPLTEEYRQKQGEHGVEVIATIALEDTQKGYEHLIHYFAKKIVCGDGLYKAYYRLNQKDIDYFKSYTNTYSSNRNAESKRLR